MQTVAVVQAGTVLGDSEATLAKFRKSVAECAGRGASLAVFPEAFFGGYPKGMTFGTSLGIRTDEGRQLFADYARCAVAIPGDMTDAIADVAREHSVFLVVGVVERERGTLYCSVIYIGPDGALLGKHRKLVPTALERIIWGCGDASTLDIVNSPIGRIGALICWENYMPLARMAMYAQDVELYCAPTVDDRETWIPTIRHIAREGRCYVLSSCQLLSRNSYPDRWSLPDGALPDPVIRGGSCIVGPLGDVIAGPLYGKEGVITAQIDLAARTGAQFDFDVVGHYARPDVFDFKVKRSG